MIEHFKLDKSCLACLHCCVILVSFDAFLLRDVLNVGQILDRSSTAPSKHAREPAAPVTLLRNLRQFDVVLEPYRILFPFTLDFAHLACETSSLARLITTYLLLNTLLFFWLEII